MLGLIWVQTVSKGYLQTTLVGKELTPSVNGNVTDNFSPLHTDGIIQLWWYNKLGMVHLYISQADYIYMSRDLWTPALMTFSTFYVKIIWKTPKLKKLRNLTCFYIALNLFRWIVEYNWQLFLIKLLRYHAICFHGNNFTLTTVRIFKVWSVVFRSCKLQAKMNQCQLFCKFYCTHTRIIKSMLERTSMFFMYPTNLQIRKLTLTS